MIFDVLDEHIKMTIIYKNIFNNHSHLEFTINSYPVRNKESKIKCGQCTCQTS